MSANCPKCNGSLRESEGSVVSPYINTYHCTKCDWVGLRCGNASCDGYLVSSEMGYPNTVRYSCPICYWSGTGSRM